MTRVGFQDRIKMILLAIAVRGLVGLVIAAAWQVSPYLLIPLAAPVFASVWRLRRRLPVYRRYDANRSGSFWRW